MGLMDMFRTAPATPPANATTSTAATLPNPNDPTNNGNNAVPGAKTVKPDGTGPVAFPKAAEGDESPLANFVDLWQPDPKAPKTPALAPTINADPAKLMAAAKTIDFTKFIPAELQVRIDAGDKGAAMEAMNITAQAGFAQAAHATTRIVTEALTAQAKTFRDEILPQALRQHSIASAVGADNPLTANPAAAPILDLITAGLTARFPNASAAEIQRMSKDYTVDFGTAAVRAAGYDVVKPAAETGNSGPLARKDENWELFFGQPPAG